jgi:hypothetical protein
MLLLSTKQVTIGNRGVTLYSISTAEKSGLPVRVIFGFAKSVDVTM